MKKFWVAMMSIFVLLGGVILSACTKQEVSLSLSSSFVEISIDDPEDKIVTAEVKGVSEGRVSTTSSNTGIVVANVVYNSATKLNTITLKVPTDSEGKVIGNEGTTQVIVTSLDDSTKTQTITVNVYSDILGMEQKKEDFEQGKNPFYAIRGGEVTLDYSKLLSFTNNTRPNARKDISWELVEEGASARIEENKLLVDSTYAGSKIKVRAISQHDRNITCEVELNVIDKIDEDSVQMYYRPTEYTDWENVNDLKDRTFRIVPNLPDDDYYDGYIQLSFKGNSLLDVEPVIKGTTFEGKQIIRADRTKNPEITNDSIIYTYRVFALNEQVNGDSKLSFNIKYSDYDYSVETNFVEVQSYEKINALNILDENKVDISNSSQLVYTSYQNGYGKLLNIELLPTTVVSKEGKFTISVDCQQAVYNDQDGNIIDKDTVKFYYRTRQGNNILVRMEEKGRNQFASVEDSIPLGVSQIYVVAGYDQVKTSIQNINITFTSVDNPNVKSTITTNLYRSASALTFTSEDKNGLDFVASTALGEDREFVKRIRLEGQTSIVGLSTQTFGNGFVVSNPYNAVAGQGGVSFDIKLTVTSAGVTENGSYRIVHENGLVSAEFDVSLFLPLTDATINYDLGTGNTSVNWFENNNTHYVLNGLNGLTEFNGKGESLSKMLLQTNSSIPLQVSKNKVGRFEAEAEVKYTFLDKTEENEDVFHNLSANEIYNEASKLNGSVSAYLGIGRNGTIITNSVAGSTYIVATFTGKQLDSDGNLQDNSIVRIIEVEVHVAMGILSTSQTALTVYAGDSVNSSELANLDISISLGDRLVEPVTYDELQRFSFRSTKLNEVIEGTNNINWTNGNYYSLSNIIVNGKTMTFTLVGNTTLGEPEFNDNLIIEYEYRNIFRRIVLDIRVVNADRIERVEWVNQSEEGLYFELNSLVNRSAVLVMSTSPSNAKDQSLSYFVTDRVGNPANFVRIDEISRRGIVNMNATSGASGYIYVMPKDAYNGNSISYFYKDGSVEKQASVSTSMIGRVKEDQTTWFEYLRDNAYFKNNQNQEISFRDILVQIPVTVADGKSWDTAYRLYDSASFAEINSFNYYIVMNSVVLNNWQSINEFQGGIKGLNKDVTISLGEGSQAFINVLKKTDNSNNGGEVRDLTFTGNVSGNGFVANVNYGLIDNVTIDVNVGGVVSSSQVNSEGNYAGGLVGENYGEINNVGVLGVIVESGNSTSYVGGIAGYNNGVISNARVEFYTFKDNKVNTLKGSYVGGLIGYGDGGSVELSYAYDYSLSNNKTANHLVGQAGAFVGFVNNDTSISQSFSVVNVQAAFAGKGSTANLSLQDTYVSYYNGEEYQSTITGAGSNWVTSGDGFLAYVNGGKAHLKNNYQAKEVTAAEVQNAKINRRVVKNDRFYQALEVGQTGVKAILFYYTPNEHDSEDLTSNEINYLASLNRISLSDIFGDIADRLVISSSNINIVDVANDSLLVKRTGSVQLTISSKQNYMHAKPIEVQVIYALSALQVSWSAGGQATNHVKGDVVNIQKESNISIQYSMLNSDIYLGVSENAYKMMGNTLVYNYQINPNSNLTSNMAGNILSIQTTTSTAELSNISTWISVNDFAGLNFEDYNTAIKNEFSYNFDLKLFEGAIRVLLSQNQLPITPSEVGVLEVELVSNNKDDKLDVEIVYNGENGYTESLSGAVNANTRSGIFSRGGEERIEVKYELLSNVLDSSTGRTTFKYRFTFAVASSYKNKVSKLEDYTVTMRSFSNVRSNSFALKVNKQEFTNIDIKAYEARLSYSSIDNATLYTLDKNKATSVLKPGDIALLEVKVNPTYAYYDYFDLVVSGSPNANAVGIGYMKSFKGSDNVFVDGEYRTITGGIRVTEKPTTEKELSTLIFKVWIDPNLAQDADIELILTFNHDEDGYIDHTSCFLSISYLAEPSLKVDGKQENAMIARGTIVPVEVEVNYDQSIDLSSASLINIQEGISLSPDWKESRDPNTGRKIFSTTLTATVNASLRESATEFYVFVRISRIINGAIEWKETRVNVKLVDFMIDGENVNIFGQNGDRYLSYLGIEQSLKFDYNLFPETYSYDPSNITSAQKVAELNQKRIKFNSDGFYQEEGNNYSINYNFVEGNLVKIPLWERLSYWSDLSNGWVDIYNKESKTFNTAGGNYQFAIHGASYDGEGNITNHEACELMVTGLRQTVAPTRFKLKTYIQNGGSQSDIALKEYSFEMDCDTYSSEYLPIIVRNEEDFDALREGDPQDYILTSDIVLEDYTPFSTGSIRSLDGNGYTIYINSFNTALNDSTTLKLALFNEVREGTTLKNIRVNIYNGGNIDVDISKYTNGAQIAGFAITNQGVITNCEVVSFYQSGKNPSRLSGETGLNIKFINGRGNTSESYLNDNSTWRQTQVAGFVIDNMGNITNSRVGGDSVVRLTDRRTTEVANSINQSLETFYINAQGDMAGFVLNNNGSISSSFAKNIAMNNKSNSTNKYLSGFVGVNAGKVLSSYVEGVKEENSTDPFCNIGTSLTSTLGVISGFVYTNQGSIKDTYSNILITNNRANDYVFLASGFVYNNEGDGLIENSYSASQVTSSKYSQMNFTGITIDGEIKNQGKYINNYYYYSSKISGSAGSITEEDFNTGATKLDSVSNQNYFYGFAFASDTFTKDGVWELTELGGPKLVEPNIIALSNRYEIENPNGTVEGKTYLLPYSFVETQDKGRVNTSYGSKDNPIIIRTAKEFNEVMGNSKDSDISKNYNSADKPNQIFGSYRLVDDIDLNELITSSSETTFDLSSVNYSFTGKLYGNGFNISNLSIGARDRRFAFGMFASIENQAIVLNFNLTVNQVINNESASTGALAGIVRNAKIVNVEITGNEGASIEGGNFVGGVAGMVIGKSQIKNVSIENIKVLAVRYDTQITENESVFTKLSSQRWRMEYISRVGSATIAQVSAGVISNLFDYVDRYSYSYAGGLVGYADIYNLPNDGANQSYQYSTLRSLKDYDLTTLRASGDISVMGQVAGGVIGYQGVRTMIMDAGLTINGNSTSNNSHIVATKFYAGGVVGQANSALSQIFAEHSNQDTIESNIANYYNSTSSTGVERGALDLFGTGRDNESYTQKAIGGLIGLANGGSLVISYSKLNVVANTTEYAGGIIGKVDTQENSTYSFSNGLTDDQASYLLHEVYATGDVRARFVRNPSQDNQSGYAGGIVGCISKRTRLALMSVNAMNMLSTYNYATDEELLASDFDGRVKYVENEDPTEEKTFSNLHVYAIAGKIENETPSNSLIFSKRVRIEGVGNSEGGKAYASVGFVLQYNRIPVVPDKSIKATAYEGYNIRTTQSLETDRDFYINGYTSFDSILSGFGTTFGVFVGSRLWDVDNWNHTNAHLYPSIRYTVAKENFKWLDAYEDSIYEVLSAMQENRNLQVRVRGYAGPNTPIIQDIDIRKFMNTDSRAQSLPNITDFQGQIIYSRDFVNSAVKPNGEEPRIILDRPLINTAGEGFAISGVTFELSSSDGMNTYNSSQSYYYQPQGNETEEYTKYSGAIVNTDLALGSIANVNIIVKNTVHLYGDDRKGDVGLLASHMSSTDIDTLVIRNEIFDGSALLLVGQGGSKGERNLGNVGLVAGSYVQNNIKAVEISNLKLIISNESGRLAQNDIIAFTRLGGTIGINDELKELSVGGFFGRVSKEAQTDNREMTGDLAISSGVTDYSPDGDAVSKNISSISLNDLPEGGKVNVGGFVGRYQGATSSLKVDGDTSYTSAQFRMGIKVASNLGALNAGILIGRTEGSYTISLSETDTKNLVEGFITTNSTGSAGTANVGGIIGYAEGEITLTNTRAEVAISGGLENVDYNNNENYLNLVQDLSNSDETDSLNKITSSFKVSQGNIGGLIGCANSTLTIDSTNSIKVNENRLPISVSSTSTSSSKPTYIGGLVGCSEGNLDVKNYVVANSTLMYEDATTEESNVTGAIGGFVGYASGEVKIRGELKTSAQNSDSKLTQISRSQVLTNANAVVGGILGEFNGIQAIIQGTAFGGAHKILGGKTTTFGGTIGTFAYKTNTTISLKDNFNFGDVFNINDTEFASNGYNFGGIIGSASGTAKDITAQNNFSLVTNHNQIYFERGEGKEPIKAMFGDGAQVAADDKTRNYYNHALSMAIDDQASDMAYGVEYDTNPYRGYGDVKSTEHSLLEIAGGGGKSGDGEYPRAISNIGTLLAEELKTADSNFGGTKLKPYVVKSTTTQDETTYYNINSVLSRKDNDDTVYFTTNGIKYYRLQDDLELNTSSTLFEHSQIGDSNSKYYSDERVLKDIALIGDSFTLNYEQKIAYADREKDLNPIIAEMQGYAFVSGMNVNVDVESESMKSITATDGNDHYIYGGLVNKIVSGKIYSVGVTGNISIGGTENTFLGGIVGKVEKGSIEESNSSVNIVYRGAGSTPVGLVSKVSLIGGIAGVTENAWIRYSYSAGSIFTYTEANVFAISSGDVKTHIEDSYTIEHMGITDVTTSEDVSKEPDLVGSSTIVSFGYSQAASEVKSTNDSIKDISAVITPGITTFNWAQTYDQNYNYPIRKNLYAHATSYYVRTDNLLEYNEERGINRYEYSRVSLKAFNKNLNTQEDGMGKQYYFGIPNVEVLSKINCADDNKNPIILSKSIIIPANNETGEAEVSVLRDKLVILNDLDIIKAYGEAEEGKGNWTSLIINASCKLDGNGKAIKNIKNAALFSEITGTLINENNVDVTNITVENIRLIDYSANKDVSGALANEINCATINNVTAQGNTIRAGVIGTATNSTIKNVSSLLIINNLATKISAGIVNLGGIVGKATNSEIKYCNNNGTIIIKEFTEDLTVGGIAGLTQGTIVDNCYNTAGIAINYTIGTSNRYFLGGVVGRSAKYTPDGDTETIVSDITNCYNTGLIRAGTKQSTGLAYIGGIVGGTDSKIENCINEASIEGRSESTWSFEDKGDILLMKQGVRHLYVYGIGYVNEGSIESCSITEEVQVNVNGNALESNTIMNAWSKTTGEDVIKEVNIDGETYKVPGMGFYNRDINTAGWNDDGPERIGFTTAFGMSVAAAIAGIWFPPARWAAEAVAAGVRLAAQQNPLHELFDLDQKNYVGYDSNNTLNEYDSSGILKKTAVMPEGEYKIEVASYDNYGFPRALKIPYTIYQQLNVKNEVSEANKNNYNDTINTVYYYFWDNLQNLAQKEYEESSGYQDITQNNNLTYQERYEKNTNITRFLSNIGTLSTSSPKLADSWETLKANIVGQGTAKGTITQDGEFKKDSQSTSIYVNGNRYYLADNDNQGLNKVLKQSIEEFNIDLEFDISTNPSNPTEIMALGNANKYLVTCDRAEELGIENISVVGYSEVNGKLKLTITIAVNRFGGDINWTDVSFKVRYRYQAEREVDFSNAIYTLYSSTGNIDIKIDESFIIPANDDEEAKIFYTKVGDNYIKHAPDEDNLSIWKTRDENKNEVYLIYNAITSTFTYYNDASIYISKYSDGVERKELVNVGTGNLPLNKKPEDFAGKKYSFFVTTIEEAETEASLVTINNMQNTSTSMSKVEQTQTQTSGNIPIGSITIGNEENINILDTLVETIRYNYTKATGKIQIPQTLTEDMYYEESEAEANTRIGHLTFGLDTIANLEYIKNESEEYTLNSIELLTTQLNTLIDGKTLTANLSTAGLDSITINFVVPDTVKEDSQITNAFINAFNLGTSKKATVEFDAFEKEFKNADISIVKNLSSYSSSTPYKVAIVADNYLLARYENGGWANLSKTITIADKEVSISVDENNLTILATELNATQLTQIKELLASPKLYKQIINYSNSTEFVGNEFDTSLKLNSQVENELSYSYNLQYNYSLEAGSGSSLSYDNGKGVVISCELVDKGNNKLQVQKKVLITPTYTWDGFGILVGDVQATNLSYVVKGAPILTNLDITITNTQSEYTLVSYTGFKVDGSVEEFKDEDDKSVGNSNIELAKDKALHFHKDSFNSSFEIENIKFINKYVQLTAEGSIKDDKNEIYIDYNYNTSFELDDFTVNLTYNYNKNPIWNGGAIANSIKYEIKENGDIEWYTEKEVEFSDGRKTIRKMPVLAYKYNDEEKKYEYFKYSNLQARPVSVYIGKGNSSNWENYLDAKNVDGKSGAMLDPNKTIGMSILSAKPSVVYIPKFDINGNITGYVEHKVDDADISESSNYMMLTPKLNSENETVDSKYVQIYKDGTSYKVAYQPETDDEGHILNTDGGLYDGTGDVSYTDTPVMLPEYEALNIAGECKYYFANGDLYMIERETTGQDGQPLFIYYCVGQIAVYDALLGDKVDLDVETGTYISSVDTGSEDSQTPTECHYIVDESGNAYYIKDLIKIQKLVQHIITTDGENNKIWRVYFNDEVYNSFINKNDCEINENFSSKIETKTSSWKDAEKTLPAFNTMTHGTPFDITINDDILDFYNPTDLNTSLKDKYYNGGNKRYSLDGASKVQFKYKLDDNESLILKINIMNESVCVKNEINHPIELTDEPFDGIILNKNYVLGEDVSSISSLDASIIGFNYYISYSLNSRSYNFISTYQDSKLNVGIKDLHVIGQMKGNVLNDEKESSLFVDSTSSNLTNLTIYGNVRNISNSTSVARSGVLNTVQSGADSPVIKNINSNVSLNVLNQNYEGTGKSVESNNAVGMFKEMPVNIQGNLSFSGLIIGGNGDYGKDGFKGKHWLANCRVVGDQLYAYGGDGTLGTLGGKGSSVNVFYVNKTNQDVDSENLSVTGLVKAGNPGADGHDGDGGRGADFFELGTYTLTNETIQSNGRKTIFDYEVSCYNEDYGDKDFLRGSIVEKYNYFYHYGGNCAKRAIRTNENANEEEIAGIGNLNITDSIINSEIENKDSLASSNGRAGLGGYIYYGTGHNVGHDLELNFDWGSWNWIKNMLNWLIEKALRDSVPDFCYIRASGDQFYGFAAGSTSQKDIQKIHYGSYDTNTGYCIYLASQDISWKCTLYTDPNC